MSGQLDVRAAGAFGADAARLISHQLAGLAARYPDDRADNSRPQDLATAGNAFLIGRLDQRPVGCGSLRPMKPGVAEVRWMYVGNPLCACYEKHLGRL